MASSLMRSFLDTPYCLDRNSNSGGILLFVREDLENMDFEICLKAMFIGINIRKS